MAKQDQDQNQSWPVVELTKSVRVRLGNDKKDTTVAIGKIEVPFPLLPDSLALLITDEDGEVMASLPEWMLDDESGLPKYTDEALQLVYSGFASSYRGQALMRVGIIGMPKDGKFTDRDAAIKALSLDTESLDWPEDWPALLAARNSSQQGSYMVASAAFRAIVKYVEAKWRKAKVSDLGLKRRCLPFKGAGSVQKGDIVAVFIDGLPISNDAKNKVLALWRKELKALKPDVVENQGLGVALFNEILGLCETALKAAAEPELGDDLG
jgi:hypothetical protein